MGGLIEVMINTHLKFIRSGYINVDSFLDAYIEQVTEIRSPGSRLLPAHHHPPCSFTHGIILIVTC